MPDKNKKEEQEGLLESSEALASELSKAEEFVENNKTVVFAVIGIVVLALAGFVFGKYWVTSQNEQAQKDLYQAVYYFESDSLGLALNGDGNNYGFIDIVNEYGMTDAANLSSYYAGATFLKLGDHESALEYLSKFSSSDYLVQARAYALMGDAKMELEAYGEAASYYEKAAGYESNKEFSPIYLQKAAVANEQNGNNQAALANYQSIIEDYFGSSEEYRDAKKHVARLKGLL